MKRIAKTTVGLVSLAVIFVLLGTMMVGCGKTKAEIGKIVANPKKYIGKEVTVEGWAKHNLSDVSSGRAHQIYEYSVIRSRSGFSEIGAKYEVSPPEIGRYSVSGTLIEAKGVVKLEKNLDLVLVVKSWKYLQTPEEKVREEFKEHIIGEKPEFQEMKTEKTERVSQKHPKSQRKAREELAEIGIEYNEAAFLKCVEEGNTTAVNLFLAAGINPNVVEDEYGKTALMFAAERGYTDIIQVLLANGADVNAKDGSGWTALMRAVESDNIKAVQALLANGAEVNAQNIHGHNALMMAVNRSHTNSIQILLANGADVNAKDNGGQTVLVYAGVKGIEIVQSLLAKGVEVNPKDDSLNVLMVAAGNGDIKTVQFLLTNGAEVNAKDEYGETALMRTVRLAYGPAGWNSYSRKYIETVRFLLANGADVNAKNDAGWTSLMFATKNGYTEIVDLLKSAGAKE